MNSECVCCVMNKTGSIRSMAAWRSTTPIYVPPACVVVLLYCTVCKHAPVCAFRSVLKPFPHGICGLANKMTI
jgi:hypothetical protein